MFSDGTTPRPPGPSPVLAGIAAGLVTLGLVLVIVWLLDDSDEIPDSAGPAIGATVGSADLTIGDCLQRSGRDLVLADCAEPHTLQAAARLPYNQDGGTGFPGADSLRSFAAAICPDPVEDHIGGDLLDTDLKIEYQTPSATTWNDGDQSVVCLVSTVSGDPLTGSVAGSADDYPRGRIVRVDRLKPNDCFVAIDDADPYSLSGGSDVSLTDCEGPHNGVFFGRTELDGSISQPYPGDAAISEVANTRCGQLFAENFSVEALGFNYRFWRPNEQSWNAEDRTVLCAVLDAEPLTEPFNPSDYVPFYLLGPLACFDLGPEESTASLRLDDRVLPAPCATPNNGQVVASGLLDDQSIETPSTNDIEQAAVEQCGDAYQELIEGVNVDSNLGDFTLWYPNLDGWEDGDRRFACAFVDDTKRQASL